MRKVLRAIASAILGLSLTTGLVAAASNIDTTGPGSHNEIKNETDFDVDNDNDVDLDADVDQDARTGDADVVWNTEGGDAESGAADNSATLGASISLDNSGSSACGCLDNDGDNSISTTGPSSRNDVENETRVDINNDNDVDIDVDVDQDANSGDAKVFGNTSGGSATSGDASNSLDMTFDVSIAN